MISIGENVSLQTHNTFGIEAQAAFLAEVHSVDDLREILQQERFREMDKLVLGGGSNLLFTRDFPGLVLKIRIGGMTTLAEDETHAWVRAGAGVGWHELVQFTLEHGYGGLESLSLIPGTVGAAPLQNIGAYGVELKETFDNLEAVEISSGRLQRFTLPECEFGYRESVFKRSEKGRYIVTSVTFRLRKQPTFNVSYGALRDTLAEMDITDLSVKAVSEAVIRIRRSKLPDPAELGNAGSFFKNPEISQLQFDGLKTQYPDLPGYPLGNGQVKVPAGWLIEQSGWKGKQLGRAGVHAKQALVLVNHGGATGAEVWELAQRVQQTVLEKFGISLQAEVNII